MGITDREVEFGARGFVRSSRAVVSELERVGRSFVRGYQDALDSADAEMLGARLGLIPERDRGFAFEGAGMALELLDILSPFSRSRLPAFLRGPASSHRYMVHVGAGWAWARLGIPPSWRLRRLEPVIRWLALDGFGFHEAFFRTRRTVEERRVPRVCRGELRPLFDAGVGRALWFVFGADPDRIGHAIAGFEPERRPSLWSGIGLASCHAGGASESSIDRLRERAHGHEGALAQGAAFAAKVRVRAGLDVLEGRAGIARHTGVAIDVAAKQCDLELDQAIGEGGSDREIFERWRSGLRGSFGAAGA